MEFSAKQIAEFIQGKVIGDENTTVHTFAKIEEGIPGAISFLANPKYTPHIYTTQASIVLVGKNFKPEQAINTTLIEVENPYESLAKLMNMYEMSKPKRNGVDPLAFVAATAKLGEGVYVAPFAYVGEHVTVGDNTVIHSQVSIENHAKIGADCIIYPNASIYHDCIVGNNCILHSGCVIGADGFGFAPTAGGYEKIPQIGIAILEDNVEIGANTCIDRATMGATIIRKGVKLDNLVQIAHNVEVGEHTVMASQVGIAGSTKVGQWNMFGGQVGIAGHVTIGDKTSIGAQAGIAGSVKSNSTIQGSPAIDHRNFVRSSIIFKKLPEIYQTVNALQKELDEIKKTINR